jgi:Zn finger protein HypA/HybF involved in hydrogenase expression
MKMGKSYQFYCKECELDMILYEGIKYKPDDTSINYYCFKCNKISYHDACLDCGDKLYYSIEIPKKKRKMPTSSDQPMEIKLACPKCRSKDTILTKIGEWVL